jgi:hypothetical protein
MPGAPPVARALARQVLRHEVGDRAEPTMLAEAADHIDARLRGRLEVLIGSTGYTILVARAVRLAQAEVPTLERVTGDAGAKGGLQGIREFALANGDAGAVEAGLTAILARVIGLLVTFIGEDLAVRLVREAWPELADDRVASEGQV